MKAGDYTNQLMNSVAFNFRKVFYGASVPQPRWRMCVDKVSSTLGFAVGSLYIERAFDEQARKEVRIRTSEFLPQLLLNWLAIF